MANSNNNFLVAVYNSMENGVTAQREALPKAFNSKRYLQNCINYIKSSKADFTQCEPSTVASTFLKGAFLNLEFGTECYAIPYKNNCEFQASYIGNCKIAKKYSIRKIKDLYAKLVREGDEFSDHVVNGQQSIDFSPKPFNNGAIIGAFAVVLYEDGGMDYETMSAAEINETRDNFSKAKSSGAWINSYGEMCKKTVLRRLCKHIEIDFETAEMQQLFESESDFDINKKPEPPKAPDIFSEPIDVEVVEEVPEEMIKEMPFK